MGYHLAGFDVVGVDIEPQPNYPFTFIQADAIEYLKAHGHEYDAIHASPPCQAYSNAQRIQQREHPELIGPTRSALVALGRPWVIENVPGAPMHDAIKLCGTMFGLRTYRHRLFEASFELIEPEHPEHTTRQAKMGRPIGEGEFIQVVGNFSNASMAREVMGMPWATRDELREAIPTAYTRFIGEQLLAYLRRQPLQEKGRPMGNTLDMAKIKEDHQARTQRICDAARGFESPGNWPDVLAAALTELATIWREEANRLSELPSPKPRGWKTTMDSLRDCATRVSGIAVAMRNHGLPDTPFDGVLTGGTGAPPWEAAGDADPKDDHASTLSGDKSSAKSSASVMGDAGPKEPGSPASAAAKALEHTAGTVSISSVLGANARADTPLSAAPHPSDDPVAFFLDGLKGGPGKLVDKVREESLAEAASAIIERVHVDKAEIAKQARFYDPTDAERAGFTIGAADAPPAWAALPEVPRFELDSPMALDSPGHTSVSQANLVSECALKWKLAKRHGAPERPGWALVGGKAFHNCVELIELWGRSDVAEMWRESFGQAIEQTQAENPLFPIGTWHASNKGKEDRAWWDADGPEMVHRYLEWRAKWVADGWELLRTADGRTVVELEFLAFIGGSPVKGFIDSAWYHPGRNMIAIVDWKSGTSKPADYFQQATYRHALEPLLGEFEYLAYVKWLGAFWDARSGELGPLVDLDVRHPKAEVEMRLSMPRRIDAAGLYMPNVNTGYGGCGSCSLKRSCPVGSRIGTGEVKL